METSERSDDEPPTTDSEDVDDASTILGTLAANCDIDALTGKAYASRSQNAAFVRCPYPHIKDLLRTPDVPTNLTRSSTKTCDHVLTRAYDLRRHFKAEHGVAVDREKVDAWVKTQKSAASR